MNDESVDGGEGLETGGEGLDGGGGLNGGAEVSGNKESKSITSVVFERCLARFIK